jgi:hypothetical protein
MTLERGFSGGMRVRQQPAEGSTSTIRGAVYAVLLTGLAACAPAEVGADPDEFARTQPAAGSSLPQGRAGRGATGGPGTNTDPLEGGASGGIRDPASAASAGQDPSGLTPPPQGARPDGGVSAADPRELRADASAAATDARTPEPAVTRSACALLPQGSVSPCSVDPVTGTPSQRGSLAIRMSIGGPTQYLCATAWTNKGYAFKTTASWVADRADCCTTTPRLQPIPPPSITNAGYLGRPHGPSVIKPHELVNGRDGDLRQNPFAIVIEDQAGGQALEKARAAWRQWAGTGQPQAGPDGKGAYYFPSPLTVNYTVLHDRSDAIVVVVAPEVSLTPDHKQLLGHPTLGACSGPAGGTPLVLVAGELKDTLLNNDSGRYGLDASVTAEALNNAAKLLNARGVRVTTVDYRAPRVP